ncbi:MAG TPA: pyruvate dehydrogenase (acetyl-transferring) E1 component subunit alpha [Gemmatimonadaceae bacterium]|nr:pyruvate dehydrogenase (acetyl-transferring) E1 component subunit alpha [Gemmatimonadaceae bacterium]
MARTETKPRPRTKPAAPRESDETGREYLRTMLLQRRFEERCAEAYALGKVGGFCHLYIGQEAVSTGIMSVLRDDDYVITTYRDHGQALARGVPARGVMAELFGRVDGCAHGKGGSMHIFDRNVNFLGGHGIVGGHIPLATGVAFAIKYRGGDQVIACSLGEAAVNIGGFHEALNIAQLWKLPAIYIIENNRYGMGTAVERAAAGANLYDRAAAYSMACAHVDGQDVYAVRAAMQEAVERGRTESLPTLLEIRTYRYMGHSMSDAASGTYRSKAELEQDLKRDPIELHKRILLERKQITEAEIAALDEEMKKVVQDAWDFADQSPEPPPAALFEDILVDSHT